MNSPETNGCIRNLLACQFEVRRLTNLNAELFQAVNQLLDAIQVLPINYSEPYAGEVSRKAQAAVQAGQDAIRRAEVI